MSKQVGLNESRTFITCQKYRRLLRRFQTMTCTFRGRRSTLDVSIFILRGCGSCGILGHVMKIGRSLPQNIGFEVAPKETP